MRQDQQIILNWIYCFISQYLSPSAMSEGEYRLIRITIQLKRLNLGINFPCSISFQLKNQNNYIETRHNYHLRNGECTPNDRLSLDLEVLYQGERYADKSVHLIVFMTSANGKIPAGSTFVSATELGMLAEKSQQSLGLSKCPDKHAKIYFTKKVDFIRSVRKMETQTRNQKVKTLLIKSRNLRANTSGNKKQVSGRYLKSGEKEDTQKYISINSRKNIKDKWSSGVKSPYMVESYDQLSKSQASQIESRLIYKLDEENFISKNEDNHYSGEKQKLEYLKQISKLKGQLNLIKRNQFHDNEEQIQKYHGEIDRLTEDLERIKERYKNLQRKEKQTTLNNRDLKDEIEKMKNRISQHELVNMESQLLLEQRQKIIKALSMDLKEAKEQLEDLKLNKSAQEKKFQFKDQSSKQQLQKLNEKYQQSEAQRQKNLYDLNNKLAQLGEIEKKNQLSLKEKQRAFLDEKSILTKKIQALTKQNEKLHEENQQARNQNKELSNNLASLNKKLEEKVDELTKLKTEKQGLEVEVKKYEGLVEKNEKQIEELKIIMEERNKLKKKYQDQSVENDRHKQLCDRHSKAIKQLEKKLKDAEASLAQNSREKNALNTKVLTLFKELENSKKMNDNKDREIEGLNNIIENTTVKMNEFKIKSENDHMRNEDARRELEEDLTFLLKTKQHLQSEYEQTKWKLSKTKENADVLHDKLTRCNDDILKFNQELLSFQEKNKKLIEEVKENENMISLLKNQKDGLEQKDKEMSEMLKARNENIYELSKTVQQKEQENYILAEKSKQKETFYGEKSKRDEDIIKNKDSLIKELKDKISQLEQKITEKEDKMKTYENDLMMKNQEIVYHKEMGEKIKEDERAEEKLKSNYYSQLMETKKKLQDSNDQIDKQNQKLKKAEIQFNSFKNEFEKYKQENIKAFEQFLIEVGKEDLNQNNYTLYAFPDLKISNMQIEAFKKRNAMLLKHKDMIKDLEENKSLLEMELQKTRKYFSEQEQQLEESLTKYKDKSKGLQKDLLSEKERLYENIRVLEEKVNDLKHENERLINDVKNDRNYIEELNKQVDKLSQENMHFQGEIHGYQKKITEYQIFGNHSSSHKQSDYSSTMNEKRSELEKYKSTSATLERKLMNVETSLNDKDESIRKYQKEISNLSQAKMKLEQDLEFSKKKNVELNSTIGRLENQIKNLDRKYKEKAKIEQDLNTELSNQKFKVEEVKLKLGKANETLIEHSNKIENMTRQLQANNSNRLELTEEAKKAQKSYKELLEKANEDIIKLKEKQILLNSEIQLKDFLVQQNQTTIKNIKTRESELQAQLSQKKADIISMDAKISQLQSQIMFIQENHTLMTNQKESLERQYHKQKSKIQQSNKQLLEYQITLDTLANKEKQIQKLKDDLDGSQVQFNLIVKDLRATVSDLRKEMSQKNIKEEELRRKIRQQEKVIEKKNYDILSTKKKYKGQAQREKVQILHDLEEVQRENTYLQREFELQQEHFNRQIENLTNQSMSLNAELTSKDQIIKNKDKQIKEYEQKLKKIAKTYMQSDVVERGRERGAEGNFHVKSSLSHYSNYNK